MCFRLAQAVSGARLEEWGGPMVRDAAHEAPTLGRLKRAAPHHEAGRDHGCIKSTGICISHPLSLTLPCMYRCVARFGECLSFLEETQ